MESDQMFLVTVTYLGDEIDSFELRAADRDEARQLAEEQLREQVAVTINPA